MEGGELFAKISERTTPFTEQGLSNAKVFFLIQIDKRLKSIFIYHYRSSQNYASNLFCSQTLAFYVNSTSRFISTNNPIADY